VQPDRTEGRRDSGLMPLLAAVDMPDEQAFRAGLVVAEPARPRGRTRGAQETRS